MWNFEQSGFCLSGTLLPVLPGRSTVLVWTGVALTPLAQPTGGARCSKPRLASLAAGVEKLWSAPKHGHEYGQDWPYRYFSNDFSLTARMTYPPLCIMQSCSHVLRMWSRATANAVRCCARCRGPGLGQHLLHAPRTGFEADRRSHHGFGGWWQLVPASGVRWAKENAAQGVTWAARSSI